MLNIFFLPLQIHSPLFSTWASVIDLHRLCQQMHLASGFDLSWLIKVRERKVVWGSYSASPSLKGHHGLVVSLTAHTRQPFSQLSLTPPISFSSGVGNRALGHDSIAGIFPISWPHH